MIVTEIPPVPRTQEWVKQSACLDEDDELFFHPPGERGRAKRERDAAALAICRRCDVVGQCLADALARGDEFGVRGGMTDDEREPLIKEYRDRPTVAPVPAGHGTPARAQQHRREGTKTCRACLDAENTAHKERANRRAEQNEEAA